MNIRRLLYGEYSKYLISIILGFGLATLFRFSCENRKCIRFVGPPMNIVNEKVFKYDDGCIKLKHKAVKCDKSKKVVRFQV
jgi:hypothetical protein